MFERGHPLTIFFNDRGILVASKKNAAKFADQQAALVKLARDGATLLACPNCMKHYGIAETDLVDGIRVGNPQVTGDALFRDGTKTLSW
jgi:intracellular sulfur oxidation DsrE/DsrF family protein